MSSAQAGILADVPAHARYLSFELLPGGDARAVMARVVLAALSEQVDGEATVVGLGASLVKRLGADLPDLKDFPGRSAVGIDMPSTPNALWCWLRGEDRGELLHRTRTICKLLEPSFRLSNVTEAFRYGSGLDLSGYEDGTENPEGDEAVSAAIAADGSSYVAVQHWQHDLNRFQNMAQQEQDHVIGRRLSDNEELDDAPESAHVKRTAQESFSPEAFMLRRSMPWTDAEREGLVFVAFGKSFYAFEAQLKRMLGEEDGIPDALFRFTQPISGSYYWCPPMKGGRMDLSALGV